MPDQIDETDRAARRLGGEALLANFPAGFREVLPDVGLRFFVRLGGRRARPEIDQRLDMRERFFAGELEPRLTVSLTRRLPEIEKESDQEKNERDQGVKRPSVATRLPIPLCAERVAASCR